MTTMDTDKLLKLLRAAAKFGGHYKDAADMIEAADSCLDDALVAKDQAYLERNHLVAALAQLYPSGIMKTDIPGWSDDWHGCVLIQLPSGQISYHYHDSHAHLFKDLPPFEGKWDGHSKETVHTRLGRISEHDPPADETTP